MAGELDILLKASREIDAVIKREQDSSSKLDAERTASTKLAAELGALKARFTREAGQAHEQFKTMAIRDAHLRSQLAESHKKIELLSRQRQKLEGQIALLKSENTDQRRSTEIELNTLKATLEHTRRHLHQMEAAQAEVQPQISRIQAEMERVQAESLQKDHRHQSSLLNYRTQENQLQESITGLKEQLRRAQTQLAEVKNQAGETLHYKRLAEQAHQRALDLHRKAQELTEANQALKERAALEKQRREQFETASRSVDSEKEMLRSCMRTAEERLAAAEEKLSRMAAELALAHVTTAMRPAPEFDPIAVTGYPIIHNN